MYVCMYMYVCQTITFENSETESSFSHFRYISRGYGTGEVLKFVYKGHGHGHGSNKVANGGSSTSIGSFYRYSPDGATEHASRVVGP